MVTLIIEHGVLTDEQKVSVREGLEKGFVELPIGVTATPMGANTFYVQKIARGGNVYGESAFDVEATTFAANRMS